MAEEKFRLPRSIYSQISKILQGYESFPGEVTLADVARIAGTDPGTVSRNNGFLIDTGLLTSGNRKGLTERGRMLARAIEYENVGEVQRLWREVVVENDFLRDVVSAIRVRRGMDAATLQTHIAYSAGVSKNPKVMAGASCVIDILELSSLVRKEEEGTLVAVPTDELDAWNTSVASHAAGATGATGPTEVATGAVVVKSGGSRRTRPDLRHDANIEIQVQIQCKPNELRGLGDKLRALLAELSGDSLGS